MPSPNGEKRPVPMLNVGETCLYFPDLSSRDPLPAVVVRRNSGDTLDLNVFPRGSSVMGHRRSVRYKFDPALDTMEGRNRYTMGDLGGLWDYIEAAPRLDPVLDVPNATVTRPDPAAPRKSKEEIDNKLLELAAKELSVKQISIFMQAFDGEKWNWQKTDKELSRALREAEARTVKA
jgi:hypothetical protein